MKKSKQKVSLESLKFVSYLIDIGLTGVQHLISSSDTVRAKSLIEHTKGVRVEPICIIDNKLRVSDCISDLQHTMLNNFIGFYSQAMAIDCIISDAVIQRNLDKFSPDRDIKKALSTLNSELLKGAQKAYEDNKASKDDPKLLISKESYDDSITSLVDDVNTTFFNTAPLGTIPRPWIKKNISLESNNESLNKIISDATNLSIGKYVVYSMKDSNNETRQIPISFRFITGFTSSNFIADALTYNRRDMTANDLKHGWLSGRLRFIQDIVFARKLIKDYRKNLMRDKDGYFRMIQERKSRNEKVGLISLTPSLGGITNVLIISKHTAELLENKGSFRFSSFKEREEMFLDTSMMITAVVDDDYRMVNIYFQSIEKPLMVSFNDLKNKSKNANTDLKDILTALIAGQPPRF